MGIIAALMLAAVVSGNSSSACECPESLGAPAGALPLIIVPDLEGNPALIACGHLEERASDRRVTASEFEVFRCGTDHATLTFDARQTCVLEPAPTGLRVTSR